MLDHYPDYEPDEPYRCTHRLQCSCGTWDSRHEGFCETVTGICEDCREQELWELPEEPDPLRDHVKDLTDQEIDELVELGIPELETVQD